MYQHYLGVDLHRRRSYVVLMDAGGKVIVPLVCPTFVYPTWQSLGEWLHRILQWQDAG